MSHASWLVKFPDNEIWHYEYDWTLDIVLSHIYKTFDELKNSWRKWEWLECNCWKEENVEITTTYWWWFYFKWFSCRRCKNLRIKETKEWFCNYDVYELTDIKNWEPKWATEYYNKN